MSAPSVDHGNQFAEEDVRAVVRFLGQMLGMPEGSHAKQKRHLMSGLCELVGADCWAWGLYSAFEPGGLPVSTSMIHDGFSDDQYVSFLQAIEHPDMAALNSVLTCEFAQKSIHVTRRREQIDTANRFTGSEAYPLWTRAGIGPIMVSVRPVDRICQSVVGIYRGPDKAMFTPRESNIAHIVLSEMGWLHEQGWPKDRGATVPQLSPRQRVTLNLLLDGRTRLQVADHLEISHHTANDYVQTLFKHFGVRSQAELLSRFYRDQAGDSR